MSKYSVGISEIAKIIVAGSQTMRQIKAVADEDDSVHNSLICTIPHSP